MDSADIEEAFIEDPLYANDIEFNYPGSFTMDYDQDNLFGRMLEGEEATSEMLLEYASNPRDFLRMTNEDREEVRYDFDEKTINIHKKWIEGRARNYNRDLEVDTVEKLLMAFPMLCLGFFTFPALIGDTKEEGREQVNPSDYTDEELRKYVEEGIKPEDYPSERPILNRLGKGTAVTAGLSGSLAATGQTGAAMAAAIPMAWYTLAYGAGGIPYKDGWSAEIHEEYLERKSSKKAEKLDDEGFTVRVDGDIPTLNSMRKEWELKNSVLNQKIDETTFQRIIEDLDYQDIDNIELMGSVMEPEDKTRIIEELKESENYNPSEFEIELSDKAKRVDYVLKAEGSINLGNDIIADQFDCEDPLLEVEGELGPEEIENLEKELERESSEHSPTKEKELA